MPSAGFFCEAFDYLTRERDKLSTKDLNTLQTKTFYAKEKKSLAYVIGIHEHDPARHRGAEHRPHQHAR